MNPILASNERRVSKAERQKRDEVQHIFFGLVAKIKCNI